MKSQTRAIILLQYLNNRETYDFSSSVLTILEEEKGQNDVVFSVDNFSDSLTSHYAKALIEESTEILLVCDLKEAEKLGPLQVLLNLCVKKKGVSLISIGESQALKPFMTFLKGKEVEDIEELREVINPKKLGS